MEKEDIERLPPELQRAWQSTKYLRTRHAEHRALAAAALTWGLQMQERAEKAETELIGFVPLGHSPCGHCEQYAWTEDGGKHIICLICEKKELEATIATLTREAADDALHNKFRDEVFDKYEKQVATLTREKNGAYAERDNLVAALSKIFPSSLERHPDSDTTWEDDWRWIVFVELPTGQATWHIHDSELAMFDHLPRHMGKAWDGHTTPQKYLRLAALSHTHEGGGQ